MEQSFAPKHGAWARKLKGIWMASPFVKWAGGKRSLLPKLLEHFPERIGTYWEPFVGGGAVFFALEERINKAILSDSNAELVTTYRIVQDKVSYLLGSLRRHEKRHHDHEYFYKVRSMEPKTETGQAARLIYLNRTCFNGLYRVNSKGKFNAPRGDYVNPRIRDPEGLKSASKALERAWIQHGDFDKVVQPKKGDWVYCDPPYDDTFTGYQPDGFRKDHQIRLRDSIVKWVKAGAHVVASNSDTPLIRELYSGRGGGFFTFMR